jgi:hypothetical protein
MKNPVLIKRLNEVIFADGRPLLQIATEFDIPVNVIYSTLQGISTPNTGSIIKLCKGFKVSADWLLGLSDTK